GNWLLGLILRAENLEGRSRDGLGCRTAIIDRSARIQRPGALIAVCPSLASAKCLLRPGDKLLVFVVHQPRNPQGFARAVLASQPVGARALHLADALAHLLQLHVPGVTSRYRLQVSSGFRLGVIDGADFAL